jgi:hypothetical protein
VYLLSVIKNKYRHSSIANQTGLNDDHLVLTGGAALHWSAQM